MMAQSDKIDRSSSSSVHCYDLRTPCIVVALLAGPHDDPSSHHPASFALADGIRMDHQQHLGKPPCVV